MKLYKYLVHKLLCLPAIRLQTLDCYDCNNYEIENINLNIILLSFSIQCKVTAKKRIITVALSISVGKNDEKKVNFLSEISLIDDSDG